VTLPDQVSLLCRAIQQKGRSEAKEILSRAAQQAERIVRDAEEKVHSEFEQRLAQKRQAAFGLARQLKDGANLKTGQQILLAKEALLQELLLETRQHLMGMRDGTEYPDILQSLILQAVAELPEEQCWVQVRESDHAFFSDAFYQDLMQQVGRKVELMTEPADISGGCLIYSFDKRILVDFSFTALLSRAQPRLRELLASELLEEEEK